MVYRVCIIAYLVLLGGIALWKSRDVKDQSDFAVAGRSLSPWMLVCTMLAVWIGTGLVVAYMVIVSYQFNAGGAVLEVIVGDKTILDAQQATMIAAVFIISYATSAGLMNLAWMDLVTGSIIMLTMVIAFPIYWFGSDCDGDGPDTQQVSWQYPGMVMTWSMSTVNSFAFDFDRGQPARRLGIFFQPLQLSRQRKYRRRAARQ